MHHFIEYMKDQCAALAQHLISSFTSFTIIVSVQAAQSWNPLLITPVQLPIAAFSPSQVCCHNTHSYDSIDRSKFPIQNCPIWLLVISNVFFQIPPFQINF